MAAVTVVTQDGKVQCRPDRRWYHEHPKIAFEAMSAGTPVYVRSDGRVAKARANAVGTSAVAGITAHDVNAGDAVTLVMLGTMTGWSGLTPGAYLYLSAAVAGGIDSAAASGTGNVVVPLAFVWTPSTIELLLPVRGPLAALA
jgi:hypothetical protein